MPQGRLVQLEQLVLKEQSEHQDLWDLPAYQVRPELTV